VAAPRLRRGFAALGAKTACGAVTPRDERVRAPDAAQRKSGALLIRGPSWVPGSAVHLKNAARVRDTNLLPAL